MVKKKAYMEFVRSKTEDLRDIYISVKRRQMGSLYERMKLFWKEVGKVKNGKVNNYNKMKESWETDSGSQWSEYRIAGYD